jgi:uncharacterized protein (DUF58 family)
MNTASTTSSGVYVDLSSLLAMRHVADAVDINAPIKKQAALSGLHMTRARGRGMDFDQVRIYQSGDDVRSIDWRVTARTQKPHTKLYHEERERPVMILADQSASLFFGSQQYFKSVLVARLAALMAWSTIAHGDRVGGIVFSDSEHKEIRPRRHKQAVLSIINALVEMNHNLNNKHKPANTSNHLLNTLAKARHTLKSGGRLIMISDFAHYNDECYRELYKISQHNQVMGIFVYDQLEKQLPPSGWYSVSNHQERARIFSGDQQLQTTYHQQFINHVDRLKNDFGRCGIALLEVATHEALLHTISQQLTLNPSRRYATYA